VMNIVTKMPSAGAGKLAKSSRVEGSVMKSLHSSVVGYWSPARTDVMR
jgi:hypothetical protein